MIDPADIEALPRQRREELLELLEERARRATRQKIKGYYPDTGPLRRELYPKHLAFFAAGKEHRERLFLAANRVGKTEGAGGYELVLHLTGDYPSWWEGHRFDHPISAWMAGETRQSTRDIQQSKLLGFPGPAGQSGAIGTGLIPGEAIQNLRPMPGISNAYEQIVVKYKRGGLSILQCRSYDQGRQAFQGTERHVILLDEECPYDVYTECLTRTMATGGFEGGILMLTFTPLKGMSEVVFHFIGDDIGKILH